jgi:ribonuclease HII
MAWIVGIDEAGYGPNLGPLVMTAVACRVPAEQVQADLWQLLQSAVRRAGDAKDGRVLVGDSKQVYSTARGLTDLETGVWACLGLRGMGEPLALGSWLDGVCLAGQAELRGEPWYSGTIELLVEANFQVCRASAQRFDQACRAANMTSLVAHAVVVCPPRFNALLDRWGTKGAVLAQGLTELVRHRLALNGVGEPVHYYVDKHGGRNNYAAMLQEAVPGGMVVALEERLEKSTYQVLGLGHELRLTFQPRADAAHFCVALASMASKYLRELLMLEFNGFWQTLVPNLKPTAGYPSDAARFFAAIQPAVERLGLDRAALWRER